MCVGTSGKKEYGSVFISNHGIYVNLSAESLDYGSLSHDLEDITTFFFGYADSTIFLRVPSSLLFGDVKL